MKIRIKRIDPTLPLPEYQTAGSVAFDLLARAATEIPPHTIALVPANVIVETPPGYMFLIASRSSTPKKKGLLIPNGIGVIDQDYCGENDEVMIQMYNFTDTPATVERGERIAQGIFVKIEKAELEETEQDFAKKSRGGFGSTG